MSINNVIANMPEDISKAEAKRQIKAVLAAIQSTVEQGQECSFVGFGAFTVKERAARTGRNPRTGEALEIAAAKVVSFKAGKDFKNSVNKAV